MNGRQANNSNSIVDDLTVLGLFLVFGALSGFFFALLVSRPYLQEFFFFKGDKFLIPRYSYWIAFSLLQLFGLSGAYSVCVAHHWILPISSGRLLSVALIIGLATPVLRSLTPLMNSRIGLNWDFVVAPIVFLFFVSCALCISSGSLRILPIAVVWVLLYLAAAFGFVYVVVRSIDQAESYEFVQWSIAEAMLALSFGNWLIWRERVNFKVAAEQAAWSGTRH
jgi:hypothetical protein